MTEHYELLLIVPGTQTDEEAQATVAKLQEQLQARGATITKHEFWGKRKLAYEINHIRQGFYDLTEFDLETTKLAAIDNELRLNDVVLRHQIVCKTLKTAEELAAEAALREHIAAKRQAAREKEQGAAVAAATPTPVVAEPTEPAGPIEKAKLEEKLEQMLESDKVDI